MNEPHLFWTVFSAVLGANLLTFMFVWAAITYSRHERDGTQHSWRGNGVFVAFMMPLLFLFAGLLIALDSVPAWLDYIAQ